MSWTPRNSTVQYTIWEHIEELRKTILRSLVIILAATFLSFSFYQQILSLLTLPLAVIANGKSEGSLVITPYHLTRHRISNPSSGIERHSLGAGDRVVATEGAQLEDSKLYALSPGGFLEVERLSQPDRLIVLGPIDGFKTVLKACFWFGLVVSSPLWLLYIFQFIAPALYASERRIALPVSMFCMVFLVLGLLFAFFVTIPLANEALFAFNGAIGENLWSLALYLDYTVVLLLANALAFEMSALLLLFVHYGVVTGQWLSEKRRIMYVFIFVMSALLTPPDVLTQLLMAIPLLAMYELILLYARWRQRQRLPVYGR